MQPYPYLCVCVWGGCIGYCVKLPVPLLKDQERLTTAEVSKVSGKSSPQTAPSELYHRNKNGSISDNIRVGVLRGCCRLSVTVAKGKGPGMK